MGEEGMSCVWWLMDEDGRDGDGGRLGDGGVVAKAVRCGRGRLEWLVANVRRNR